MDPHNNIKLYDFKCTSNICNHEIKYLMQLILEGETHSRIKKQQIVIEI